MPSGTTETRPDPPSDAGLTLRTLGQSPRLARGDESVLGPGKPLALIVYLSVADGHSATREFLLDLLWSDLEPDRARHALRQTLWYIRSALGDNFVFGREELTLGENLDSDRGRFLAAVAAGDPETAVQSYTGEFLPDFALPGSTEFEQWAHIERTRLRATLVRAGEMLVRRQLSGGRARDAQHTARRVREADRLNETGWRLVLESLVAGRDFVQAAVEADALVAILRQEGRQPEPATKHLLAEAHRIPDHAPDAALRGRELMAELIGREHEFATILDAWGAARQGPARHIHVSASAGLGKTRLLGDVGYRVAAMGVRPVALRANPGDRTVNFGFAGDLAGALADLPGLTTVSPATADALVDLSPTLSRRFPVARPSPARHELARVRTSALAEALVTIAEEQPVALLIDDVHWLDGESHRLLTGVLSRLNHARILVLTAGRPFDDRNLDTPITTTLPLAPLGPEGTTAMVTSLGRWPDRAELDRFVSRLHEATDGSPLQVLETLQLALDDGSLALTDGTWRCPKPDALIDRLAAGSALRARVANLDPEAGWVLLLLATAGTPLTARELASATRAPEAIDDRLWNLERHGFVQRAGASWVASHDEIAASALEVESGDRQRAAHVALARALVLDADPPFGVLVRACRHAAAAADRGLLRTNFRRLVIAARTSGDDRRLSALAAEACGEPPTADANLALISELPWRLRTGLYSTARLGLAATVTLALVAAAAMAVRSSPRVDLPTALVSLADSTAPFRVVSVDRVRTPNGTALSVDNAARPSWDRMPRSLMITDVGADGIHWAGTIKAGNILTDEIVIGTGASLDTIASSPRDDVNPTLSPDGKTVAFSTARWSPSGDDNGDLAVVDLATRELRALTQGPANDVEPRWSPDGTRIVFTRRHFGEAIEICWITVDGRRAQCHRIANVEVAIGWSSPTEVILIVEGVERRHFVALDVDAGTERPMNTPSPKAATISPDGQWIACRCQVDNSDAVAWIVFPTTAPEWRVSFTARSPITGIQWRRGAVTARPPVRLAIEGAGRPIPAGLLYRLRTVARDSAGGNVAIPAAVMSWASADTTVATIDSLTGDLRPNRPGQVQITASAGGRLQASAEVTVVASRATTLLDERWDDGARARWRFFGIPDPTLAERGGVRGFFNNGDGSFSNGAYSTRSFAADSGLGIDAMVSVPVNRTHWQQVTISLLGEVAFSAMAGWDHHTEAAPLQPSERCQVSFGGESPLARQRVATAGGERDRLLAVDSTIYDGTWHHVRLQIFPDGSCGIALDNQPRWRFRNVSLPGRSYRVSLDGNSAGTRILVGPLSIWAGVRRDLNWDDLP